MLKIKQNIIFAFCLLLASSANAQEYQKTDLGIKANSQSMTIEIQFFSPTIVRVVKYPEGNVLNKDEAIYGFGQQQTEKLNMRNTKVKMQQKAPYASLPILQSTLGYGILWDNYSPTTFNDNLQEMSIESEVGDCSDYYFMYSGSSDGVVAQIRDLTGKASKTLINLV
jgi:alpha-glucosidase (family GH31 glycosyl hydrolase)